MTGAFVLALAIAVLEARPVPCPKPHRRPEAKAATGHARKSRMERTPSSRVTSALTTVKSGNWHSAAAGGRRILRRVL
jgi:hypothetical protein